VKLIFVEQGADEQVIHTQHRDAFLFGQVAERGRMQKGNRCSAITESSRRWLGPLYTGA
jgi:hypothetical protein